MNIERPLFPSRLFGSVGAVLRVIGWLWLRGWTTELPGLRYTPDAAERQRMADNGDFKLHRRDGSGEDRCEVKHLTIDFTCRLDWPYAGKFIVMADEPWQRADPKPLFVFVVNQDRTHMAIICRNTSKRWNRELKYDSGYRRKILFQMAPTECVARWYEIDDPPDPNVAITSPVDFTDAAVPPLLTRRRGNSDQLSLLLP